MCRFRDSRPTSLYGAVCLCIGMQPTQHSAALANLVLGGECRSASAASLVHPCQYTALYEFARIPNHILSSAALTLCPELTIGLNPGLKVAYHVNTKRRPTVNLPGLFFSAFAPHLVSTFTHRVRVKVSVSVIRISMVKHLGQLAKCGACLEATTKKVAKFLALPPHIFPRTAPDRSKRSATIKFAEYQQFKLPRSTCSRYSRRREVFLSQQIMNSPQSNVK